jgi:putative aldouronate transport system permease protein
VIKQRSFMERCFDYSNIIAMCLICTLMLFPFYNLFVTSFTSFNEYMQQDIVLWPKRWILDAYTYIFSTDVFIRSMWVTVKVTLLGTFCSLLATSLMAYALSRKVWGESIFMFLILFTFVFSSGIIPDYLLARELGLINSLWVLILPGLINSFNMIVLRQFFLTIPEELTEAAVIDGGNDLQIFGRIILPLAKPALAAFGLFYAVGYWNSYFGAVLFITDQHKWTVQVVLRQLVVLGESGGIISQNQQTMDHTGGPPSETISYAAILLTTLPILIVYPMLQKHFMKGVLLGSVKG